MDAIMPGRRFTQVAKVLSDLAWWLALLITVVVVGLVLAWPLMTPAGLDPTIHVPVSISDEVTHREFPIGATGVSVSGGAELDGLSGGLELRPASWGLILLWGLVAIPGALAALFGIHLLRSFLADVLQAEVFTQENARRLSWLGRLLVVAGFAWPFLDYAYSRFLVGRVSLSGVPLSVDGPSFPAVIPGLAVLVLAAAWSYGVELQQDSDLTV